MNPKLLLIGLVAVLMVSGCVEFNSFGIEEEIREVGTELGRTQTIYLQGFKQVKDGRLKCYNREGDWVEYVNLSTYYIDYHNWSLERYESKDAVVYYQIIDYIYLGIPDQYNRSRPYYNLSRNLNNEYTGHGMFIDTGFSECVLEFPQYSYNITYYEDSLFISTITRHCQPSPDRAWFTTYLKYLDNPSEWNIIEPCWNLEEFQ